MSTTTMINPHLLASLIRQIHEEQTVGEHGSARAVAIVMQRNNLAEPWRVILRALTSGSGKSEVSRWANGEYTNRGEGVPYNG